MGKWMIVVACVALAGCVRVMTGQEVAQQFRACRAAGGEPAAMTVSKYNSAVKWVSCYGAKPAEGKRQ